MGFLASRRIVKFLIRGREVGVYTLERRNNSTTADGVEHHDNDKRSVGLTPFHGFLGSARCLQIHELL